MTSRRLFLAIPVSDELIWKVESHKEALTLPVKWIPEKNLHVTVHFFGSIEENILMSLQEKIRKITQQTFPFTLEANSIRIKHGKGQDMVWVTFKTSTSFEKLAVTIAESIDEPVTRKPLPHVNLARHKEPIRSSLLPLPLSPDIKLDVTHIELWESKLSPHGSTYFCLRSFTLKGE